MVKLKMKNGSAVYTELPVSEIRSYLQGGSLNGSFSGYEDEEKTIPILIAIHAIEYIYL